MKYLPLGNSGLYVSQPTLGAMTFDHKEGLEKIDVPIPLSTQNKEFEQ